MPKRSIFAAALVCALTLPLFENAANAALPVKVEPQGDVSSWVTPDDYPAEAMRTGEHGVVRFELNVDAAGVPTACEITGSYAPALLGKATCELLMQRARFKPASASDVQSSSRKYTNAINWVLPETKIEPIEEIQSFVVDDKGNVSDCQSTVIKSGKTTTTMGGGPCRRLDRPFPAFIDANGNPVGKRVRMINKLEVEDLKP